MERGLSLNKYLNDDTISVFNKTKAVEQCLLILKKIARSNMFVKDVKPRNWVLINKRIPKLNWSKRKWEEVGEELMGKVRSETGPSRRPIIMRCSNMAIGLAELEADWSAELDVRVIDPGDTWQYGPKSGEQKYWKDRLVAMATLFALGSYLGRSSTEKPYIPNPWWKPYFELLLEKNILVAKQMENILVNFGIVFFGYSLEGVFLAWKTFLQILD